MDAYYVFNMIHWKNEKVDKTSPFEEKDEREKGVRLRKRESGIGFPTILDEVNLFIINKRLRFYFYQFLDYT